MILGLDISTSCIGICLLENDGKFVQINYLDLKKEKNFYKKSDIFQEFIKNLNVVITKVIIEEPVKMFQSNKSMAQVISLLQSFNAVCRFIVYKNLKIEPILVMPSSLRKNAGMKIQKGLKKKEVKEIVLQYVQNTGIVPSEVWKLKKTGKVKDYCYDMADSFVCAMFGVKNDNI